MAIITVLQREDDLGGWGMEGSAPFGGQGGGKSQAPAGQSGREWQVGHS